jgi:hypothetical protein
LPAQRLLGDEAVGADGAGVDLVVHEVVELQHVDVAHRDLAVERLAGAPVVERHLTGRVEAGLFEHRLDVRLLRAVEDGRGERNAAAQLVAELDQLVVGGLLDLRDVAVDRHQLIAQPVGLAGLHVGVDRLGDLLARGRQRPSRGASRGSDPRSCGSARRGG